MHARGVLPCVVLALGCSSEPVSSPAAASDTGVPAPGDTTAAPALTGDFAPAQSYPPGPYGHGVGAVIENLEFIGWRDPAGVGYDLNQLAPVRIGDFYDPNGAETELLVLNASAVWCVVCKGEMRDMNTNGTYAAFRARKVQVLSTLFEDADSNPAKPSDLQLWGSSSARQIAFPLVLDPALKMGVYFSSDATPLNLVIDARSMRILHVMMGYDSSPTTGLWGIVDQELKNRGL